MVTEACKTLSEQGIEAAVYDMRFLKPLDEDILKEAFSKFDKIITIEDGTILGGLGSAVMEYASDNGFHKTTIHRLGIPDKFIEQGTPEELYHECGIDAEGIVNVAKNILYSKQG